MSIILPIGPAPVKDALPLSIAPAGASCTVETHGRHGWVTFMSDLPRGNADRLARTLSMHATPVRILDADRIVWAA